MRDAVPLRRVLDFGFEHARLTGERTQTFEESRRPLTTKRIVTMGHACDPGWRGLYFTPAPPAVEATLVVWKEPARLRGQIPVGPASGWASNQSSIWRFTCSTASTSVGP